MKNNNAIATQSLDEEAKIENVKPTADDSPIKEQDSRQRRRPFRREVRPEDETGKWAIRRKIWNYLEDNNLVNAPRPCHYRIPNFEGAATANDRLTTLDVFKQARSVKVSPDKPQEQARFLVLESHKNLLVPTPQLRTGLLNRVIPPEDANKEKLRYCCTSQGLKEFSKEIGLEDKVKIDLLVVGSVAVSRQGYRIGKGKGYADLEYAMMRNIGAIDADTIVVTSVHDSQVVEIPEELVEEHDMTVDLILTPSEIIETRCTRSKPEGIIWNLLEVNKFYQIPVLKQLRDLEHAAGKDVRLKGQENEDEDPLDNAGGFRPRRFRPFRSGGYRGRGRPFRFRKGGWRRRSDGGDESNKENGETGDESGPDGDSDGRGRFRNYRNRHFRRGGKPKASESEHSDAGGEDQQGDDDRSYQRRFPNRRRYQRRGRFDGGGSRRDNRGDHSGSDGEQKTSGDEEVENRRPQRQRFLTHPDAIVWVGGLSRRLRVSELKTELRALQVNPVRLVWRGARGFAFIHFQNVDSAKEAVSALSGKELDGKEIKVEMANKDRPPRRRGDDSRADSRGGDFRGDSRGGDFRGDSRGGDFRGDSRGGDFRGDSRGGDFRGDSRGGDFRGDSRGGDFRGNGRGGDFRGDGRGGDFRGDSRGGDFRGDSRGGDFRGDRGGDFRGDSRRGNFRGDSRRGNFRGDSRGGNYRGDSRGGNYRGDSRGDNLSSGQEVSSDR